MQIAVVIPALNEEASIAQAVAGLRAELTRLGHQAEIWVADNGSTDRTGQVAQAAGARVVHESRRGYGAACLKALGALGPDAEVVVFADGDGADDPGDLQMLLAPLVANQADLVVGSRALGLKLGWVEEGALAPAQRFGNELSALILRLVFGYSYSDLGPFRAMLRPALDRLLMDDQNYGWTVQMQARAALQKLRVRETPVHYRRRRQGTSKVSGSLRGSIEAGTIILRTLFWERFRKRAHLKAVDLAKPAAPVPMEDVSAKRRGF
jgi:glycosyltransferase involved in cell wall biosynthesis